MQGLSIIILVVGILGLLGILLGYMDYKLEKKRTRQFRDDLEEIRGELYKSLREKAMVEVACDPETGSITRKERRGKVEKLHGRDVEPDEEETMVDIPPPERTRPDALDIHNEMIRRAQGGKTEHPPCIRCYRPNPNQCQLCDECSLEQPAYDYAADDRNYDASKGA